MKIENMKMEKYIAWIFGISYYFNLDPNIMLDVDDAQDVILLVTWDLDLARQDA